MRLSLTCTLLLFLAPLAPAADDYKLGPDSHEQPDVPRGKVTRHTWKSEIFPGTVRDYSVYVPAQYDAKVPACIMVFQDGDSYANLKGQFRVPTVFDNLIHKKEMPVMIGIFINPGTVPPAAPDEKGNSNRSFEYDTLSDQYVNFLEKEICRRWPRSTTCARTWPATRSAASARAAFAPSPPPDSGRTCSAKC